MTELLLVYNQDNQDSPTDTLDLLCFSSEVGFQIANNGWVPAIGRGRVQESLTLHAKGDSQDEVVDYLNTILKKWQNYVIWSQDFTQEQAVWLRVKWEDETNARQARLLSLNFAINGSPFGEFWQDNYFTEVTLTFERLEWEEYLNISFPTPDIYSSFFVNPGLAATGVSSMFVDANLPYGDVNARVVQLQASIPYSQMWLGFRRNRVNYPNLFVPRWDCQLGTDGTDTTDTGDATAVSGTRISTTFATATLVTRSTITLQNITGDYANQRGKYLALLRAMNSNGSTSVNVRLQYGNTGILTTLPRVNITASTWTFYEMGVVSIPGGRHALMVGEAESAFLRDYLINIQAERISGAGSLYMDCLVLIPIDEAYVKTTFTGIVENAPITSGLWLYQNELGEVSGYIGTATSIYGGLEIDQYNWGIPPIITNQEGFIVFAANPNVVGSTKINTMSLHYIPRWQLARGDE